MTQIFVTTWKEGPLLEKWKKHTIREFSLLPIYCISSLIACLLKVYFICHLAGNASPQYLVYQSYAVCIIIFTRMLIPLQNNKIRCSCPMSAKKKCNAHILSNKFQHSVLFSWKILKWLYGWKKDFERLLYYTWFLYIGLVVRISL